MRRVSVDKNKCTGCRLCEIICSSSHYGSYNPRRARIRVPITYPMPSAPIVCRQCPNPKCVEACPTGALEKGDWVHFDDEKCTLCGACVEACPFKAIWMTPGKELLKCDLCGGDPTCVKACPQEALGLKE